MSEPTHDLLPLYETSRGFDSAMRGYDRAQVDRELNRLDEDLRALIVERDSAAARSADLAAQLASSQAQVESLRRQLRAASETVTSQNVDEKVKQKLETAAVEAARIRAEADAGAEQIRNGAADSAARTRAAAQAEAERIVAAATERLAEAEQTFKQRLAEADARRTEVEAALTASEQHTRDEEARISAHAEAERTRLAAEAAAERERLDAESLAARTQAQEDFDITLRLRRSEAQHQQAEQKRVADETAAATVSDAHAQARQLVADATHEVRRLHEVRNALHADLGALQTRIAAALAQSLAATPDAPELAPSTGSAPRPLPGAGVAAADTLVLQTADEPEAPEPGTND